MRHSLESLSRFAKSHSRNYCALWYGFFAVLAAGLVYLPIIPSHDSLAAVLYLVLPGIGGGLAGGWLGPWLLNSSMRWGYGPAAGHGALVVLAAFPFFAILFTVVYMLTSQALEVNLVALSFSVIMIGILAMGPISFATGACASMLFLWLSRQDDRVEP